MKYLLLLTIILSMYSFLSKINKDIIKYINKNENNVITTKKLYLFNLLTSIFLICLFLKYEKSLFIIRYFILMFFLNITAFIDYKTKYIYDFINVIFGLIGIIFMLIDILKYNILTTLFSVILVFFITFMLSKLNFIGRGDIDVFIIVCMYIGNYNSILNIFLAIALSGSIALKSIFKLDFKKIAKERVALCPFILISTFIILFLQN